MTTIYFDEAGNTGANLLDPEQPMFILASNDFSEDEARSLLEHVQLAQGAEPKFSTLRRRPEGIERVIRLLADPRLNKDRVRISVIHKPYMVTGKMVDLVTESLMHEIGEDLYKYGSNIALTNVLQFGMPVFCGVEATQAFLHSFVDLVRNGPEKSRDDFYAAGQRLLQACTSEEFKAHLWCFTEPALFDTWFGNIDSSIIDPAIPALFHLIAEWGDRKSDRFQVVHDRSKPIMASQEMFESMMAVAGDTFQSIGTDRRKITFPLRASSLQHGDSKQHPQLQLADICAGAINHFYKLHIVDQSDELAKAVDDLGCLEWGSNFVLPQPHFTPEDLGTTESNGSNGVEGIASYLMAKGS